MSLLTELGSSWHGRSTRMSPRWGLRVEQPNSFLFLRGAVESVCDLPAEVSAQAGPVHATGAARFAAILECARPRALSDARRESGRGLLQSRTVRGDDARFHWPVPSSPSLISSAVTP
jgi:hypothetical protein